MGGEEEERGEEVVVRGGRRGMQAMADGEGEELERASPAAGGMMQEMEQAALRCAGMPPIGGRYGVGERRGRLVCGGGRRHRQEREE